MIQGPYALSIPVLTMSNFPVWKFSINVLCHTMNLHKWLEGSVEEPAKPDPTDQEAVDEYKEKYLAWAQGKARMLNMLHMTTANL
jgi:hypothetical protein